MKKIRHYKTKDKNWGAYMYLQEVEKESNIQVIVGIGSQVLEFQTKVAEVIENGIYAEPLYQDKKLLGFRSKGLVVKIQIANLADQKVYEWINVDIVNVKTPEGNIYHRIVSKQPGKQVNRRNGCRVWVGLDGTAQIGTNKAVHDVIIKDISVNGISFVCGKDVEAELGTIVHLVFYDDATRSSFRLGAIIVRSEDVDRHKVMYGCRLNQESSAISKYVNEKQREKLRATRTVGMGTVPLEKRNQQKEV